MERKRRTRAKPKPIVRKSERTTVQEAEAPKILLTAIRQVEKELKDFKPKIAKADSFAMFKSLYIHASLTLKQLSV